MATRNFALEIKRKDCKIRAISLNLLLAISFMTALVCMPFKLAAQTGGEAGIQGTVSDPSGAAIPHAKVTVTNDATGVVISRETTGDGLYTVSPIIPGTYTVRVSADGFSEHIQRNLVANALVLTPLNIALKVGSAGTEVEVTAAPPQLETTNATLGLTIENNAYANLPLALNNAQRDPTAVGTLAPGAQGGARLPIIGGTGNYLGQLYLDGLPAQTVSQQGDNRLVSQAISVDSVDQIQVVTSTPPAEYSGAGAENFTMKSGTLKYHGSVTDFIRNTSLDAFPFIKAATKPVDHQNEFSATIGGHVPGTKRIFFFVAYDRYHNRTQQNPVSYTVPSTLQRTGDFTELNGNAGNGGLTGTGSDNPAFLYDPTTTTCNSTGCTRQPFQATKNGVLTNNIIPANYLSSTSQFLQSFLPAPTNTSTLINNYTSPGYPGGFDNHLYNYRVDFQWTPKHRISTVGAMGTVNYFNNAGAPFLPLPYTGGDLANIYPKDFDVQDAYTISNSMVNQLKFGFVRFFQNIHNATQNTQYSIANGGVTNLPQGQAGQEFPGVSFATNTKFASAVQTWTMNSNATATQITTPNNFALVDNLQWVKGAHTLTFGITVQWQEINNANPATYTGILSLPTTPNATAGYTGSSLNTANTGYSYASFLLGAVGGSPSLGLQPVSEVGGRYRPISPYVEDTWKVNSKFTIDAGLRWDYLPPYHEVKDRWSFLNPTAINPATGTAGALEFAGNYGGAGASCGCRTPVPTYWQNWGPRLGITFSPDDKTVFRAGIGHVYSQGGGVGGRGGAFNGTGQLGFNTTATGPTETSSGVAAPSFYLNNSAAFKTAGLANTDLFGKGYVYPTAPAPGVATESLNAGNYLNNGKFVNASSAPGYADPYFSSRAPDFTFYNFGMQHAWTNNLVTAINYVGNQSHHLINSTNAGTGNPRGYWTNQLNPTYLAGLGSQVGTSLTGGSVPLLSAPATPANVAKAQAAMAGISIPGYFQQAALVNAAATIAQGLVAFPQYSTVADTYGANVGNFSYNSLQVTAEQRMAHGLTFNVNYTWSRNIGDDGSFRSGFDIPSAAISRNTSGKSWHQDRIDRSETAVSAPHTVHAFGVWNLPFGKGHIGGTNEFVRALVGGWSLSTIYTYGSGQPLILTYAGCTTPLQGQCMPDVNPAYNGSPRINGGFGHAPNNGPRTACALGSGAGCHATQYFDANAFLAPATVNPSTVSAINLIGNAPRTGAFNLTGPGAQNIDTSVHRSIPIWKGMAITLEADCFNTWNHTIFAQPSGIFVPNSTTTSAFGSITSVASTSKPRAFEFAGHFNF